MSQNSNDNDVQSENDVIYQVEDVKSIINLLGNDEQIAVMRAAFLIGALGGCQQNSSNRHSTYMFEDSQYLLSSLNKIIGDNKSVAERRKKYLIGILQGLSGRN